MNSSLFHIEDLRFLGNGPYSLKICEHEIVGLSGTSGIGKTQLLRAMVETIVYTGTIKFKGQVPESFTPSQWRRLVGLVPAEAKWWGEYVGDHFPKKESQEKSSFFFEELGFPPDVRDWQIDRLSTGERQRLALARALALQPSLVLLDEPCSALDGKTAELVEGVLLRYRQNHDTALLWVSHDEEQLKRVADRCYQVQQDGLQMRW